MPLGIIKKIGIEDEYLITDTQGHIPPHQEVDNLFKSLESIGWKRFGDDVEYEKDGKFIIQDSGHALLEIIFPPYERDHIPELIQHRTRVISKISDHFLSHGYLLLAGVSPQNIDKNELINYASQKMRASVLVKLRPKTFHYRFFGPALHFNVSFHDDDSMVEIFNLFNMLSGLLILMTARQKLWIGRISAQQSLREYSWCLHYQKDSMGSPDRVNMFPFELERVDDYVTFVTDKRVLFFEHEKTLIAPEENFTFQQMRSGECKITDKFENRTFTVTLGDHDLNLFLKSFWYNTRIKRYGNDWVFESRIFDSQKLDNSNDIINLFFHIIKHRNEITYFVKQKSYDYWYNLYWSTLEHGLNKKENRQDLDDFIHLLMEQGFIMPEYMENIMKTNKTQSDYICDLFINDKQDELMNELSV